ncbi:MAG: cupin-like domain-containing protein [Deltaproteobacteria bacterium]|nr:cupin-like domain-containing protein [Deltaproteobacteria bacterium]
MDPGAVALAPAWRAWIVEQLARGVLARDVAARLTQAGLDKELVDFEVAGAMAIHRLTLASRIRRALGRSIPDRVTWPSDFWTTHWEGNLPLVLRGYARDWPALTGWSFEALRARLGDTPVAVEIERDPARHFEGRWVERPYSELADRVEGPPGNDLYMIARNENLRRPALASLLADVVVDEATFDRTRLIGGSSLWMGPAGTLTPLHFDTTNILFVQVRGHKRFDLVSPDVGYPYLHLDGFYVDGDLARLDPDDVHALTLAPGDALFIPVGWLHRVEALEASVSLSLLCFRRPNDFTGLTRGLHPRTL